jgi:ubiquinone/menaquinone biosynthesis C-methylase UbiE
MSHGVGAAYDLVAEEYAAAFGDEIVKKHFDQIILRWFASQIPNGETVLELGAGPGEVSGWLAKLGIRCLATDASPRMVACGKRLFPEVSFAVKDFFALSQSDESVHAIVAFYAIVNYPLATIAPMFREVFRILEHGGICVFTFHVFEGEEKMTVRSFLGKEIEEISFYFFQVDEVKLLVESIGFQVVDILVRHPYPGVEYGSKRAYFILGRP